MNKLRTAKLVRIDPNTVEAVRIDGDTLPIDDVPQWLRSALAMKRVEHDARTGVWLVRDGKRWLEAYAGDWLACIDGVVTLIPYDEIGVRWRILDGLETRDEA